MIRLALALAVWTSMASAAPATLTLRRDGPLFGKEVTRFRPAKAPAGALNVVAARAQASDYIVTEETEVLLNGKPCRYKDVPANATIVRMELAWDNKTVLKIYFRVVTAPSGSKARPR
jgi:hypothetical protein